MNLLFLGTGYLSLLLWRPNQITRSRLMKIVFTRQTHTEEDMYTSTHLTHKVPYIHGVWLQCQYPMAPLISAAMQLPVWPAAHRQGRRF